MQSIVLHKIGNKSGSEAGKTKCRDRIYFAEEQYNNQDGRNHGNPSEPEFTV